MKYLGYVVADGKVFPDPDKVSAIKNFTLPKTIKELRSFLGLSNFCGQFISHYATIAAVLNDLLKGESKKSKKIIIWDDEKILAYNQLKKKILEITYRSLPNFDLPFILTTDASNRAYGAVLTQKTKEGKEIIISCFSKKFDKHQENYSVTDKELHGLYKGIEHFKHYLLGKEFLLRTDHASLKYLKSASNENSRLWRIALKLQDYQYKVEFVKGEMNIADVFSRPEVEVKSINNIDIQNKRNTFRKISFYY